MKTALPRRDAPPDISGGAIVGHEFVVGGSTDITYGLSPGDVARLVQTVAQAPQITFRRLPPHNSGCC
jgi:hypothetical protein